MLNVYPQRQGKKSMRTLKNGKDSGTKIVCNNAKSMLHSEKRRSKAPPQKWST